ncbi:MAG: CHC2 zinc finger domain-containing protein, partial [Desulfobulbales bacterium]
MTTYKELKTVSHIRQNISFAESLINKSFNCYGDNKFTTYCPFHNDKEDSFRVYVNRHGEVRFHCFGTCDGDWDIYDIVMHQKKCSFRDAQQEFASYVGEANFQPHSNQELS